MIQADLLFRKPEPLDSASGRRAMLLVEGDAILKPSAKIHGGHCTDKLMGTQLVRNRIRVLVAKPGLDGHDRGAKVIARALRDAGMEVIYTGLRQSPEMIVNAALQEDVQVIGISILSGAHNAIVPEVMQRLAQKKMTDVLVIVGGTIPGEDAQKLKQAGVAAVFQPGAALDEIVTFIENAVASNQTTAGQPA